MEINEAVVHTLKRRSSSTESTPNVEKRCCKQLGIPFDSVNKYQQIKNNMGADVKRHIPLHLIGIMYRVDLSMLCFLRKSIYEHKYPSLTLSFGEAGIDDFTNIALFNGDESIHIKIEYLNKYDMTFAKLFNQSCILNPINSLFKSYTRHRLEKSDVLPSNIKYLIFYTNAPLDITKTMKFKKTGVPYNFYPFEMNAIDMEECEILKDFLVAGDRTIKSVFYQFSQDNEERNQLCQRLQFSYGTYKFKISSEYIKHIKNEFLDKLVLAAGQPNRKKLNLIVKNEMTRCSSIQDDYIELHQKISHTLISGLKCKTESDFISQFSLEMNLLIGLLHSMFLYENIKSVNFETRNNSTYNDIAVDYGGTTTYIRVQIANSSINYSPLFLFAVTNAKLSSTNSLSIFDEKKDMRNFVVYTNASLDQTAKHVLQQGNFNIINASKIESFDMQKKNVKFLQEFACINQSHLYQLHDSHEQHGKIFSVFQNQKKEEILPHDQKGSDLKKKFLANIIYAVEQPNYENSIAILRNDITDSKVPYNYEQLLEIGLTWLESVEFGPITKTIIENILSNKSSKKCSCFKSRIKNSCPAEIIKFCVNVTQSKEKKPRYEEFMKFLQQDGKDYLKIIETNGIDLSSVSSLLQNAGTNAAQALTDLRNLWFDSMGNKTIYLTALDVAGINVSCLTSILNGCGSNAAKSFQDLFNLWFDEKGNKTIYLEEQEIYLSHMISILAGAGLSAAKSFQDLYNLWFSDDGSKTYYLITLEERGILTYMTNILQRAGSKASKSFQELYNLWFDRKGNETLYLRALKKEGLNISSMASIFSGTGFSAIKSFRDLYSLWFDDKGDQMVYLKNLLREGINLQNMTSILTGAGSSAAKSFYDLYSLWFDEKGNKTKYLKTLDVNGLNLTDMTSILSGAGSSAAQSFQDFYKICFDDKGHKTIYLRTLEKEGVNLSDISSVLNGSASSTDKSFKDLYSLWFDDQGNKSIYLKTLDMEGINLSNIISILCGAGSSASTSFQDLYNLWFDDKGNKTIRLETFEMEGITLSNITSILQKSGSKAAETFKDLYNLWFDDEGNQKSFLTNLEMEGIHLSNIISVLYGAGSNASQSFKNLYNNWFDEEGNKTNHLKQRA